MYGVVVVFPFSRSSTLLGHSITLQTLLISENLLSTLSISLSSPFSFSETLICNEKETTSWLLLVESHIFLPCEDLGSLSGPLEFLPMVLRAGEGLWALWPLSLTGEQQRVRGQFLWRGSLPGASAFHPQGLELLC